MYAQRLANKHAAPTSLKNYLSGAKTWIAEHSGNIDAFLSPQLGKLVKGFTKKSNHVPTRAAPLQPHHVQEICRFLDTYPSTSLAIKPAILIGFSCFLRSSNLLSPTMTLWGGPHTLLAGDISISTEGLLVFIRSTKTRSTSQGLTFKIPPSQEPSLCPVAAWRHYVNVVNPWVLGPAFIHSSGFPVTPRQVVGLMRLALQGATDICPSQISMHSLRRGAVHTAVQKGIPIQEIKTRGTWNSDSGLKPYLLSSPRSVTVPVTNLAL